MKASVAESNVPERMYKLVLAGDAAVGKSSFILRLCRNRFHSALNSTLGMKLDFDCGLFTRDCLNTLRYSVRCRGKAVVVYIRSAKAKQTS